MKEYIEQKEGDFVCGYMDDAGRLIPHAPGNRDYERMQSEIESGEAVITPMPGPSPAEIINQIAGDRFEHEGAGVLWNDGVDTYFFDTSIDSQNRFASAQAAITKGVRTDGAIWKCAKVEANQTLSLTYLPMSNTDLTSVADLVLAHVQKCFDAEAKAVEKLMSGDLTASFQVEFANL